MGGGPETWSWLVLPKALGGEQSGKIIICITLPLRGVFTVLSLGDAGNWSGVSSHVH